MSPTLIPSALLGIVLGWAGGNNFCFGRGRTRSRSRRRRGLGHGPAKLATREPRAKRAGLHSVAAANGSSADGKLAELPAEGQGSRCNMQEKRQKKTPEWN
eukprot:1452783-Pyramimonas_sp.AAC.1